MNANLYDRARDAPAEPVRRVLILKLSSLGDVVQALPVAGALRRRYPALHITWAIEERFAALVQGHAAIDRVVTFPRLSWSGVDRAWPSALRRALRAVRAQSYDVALDLQGLFKSSVISLCARAPERLGLAPQREGARLVSRAVPAAPGRRHAVEAYLDCAARLGAAPGPVHFGLPVTPAAALSAARRLRQRGAVCDAPLIAINPSAARPWKAWPDPCWVAVIDALASAGTVVLVGGAEHCARHRALAQRARRPLIDLTGATTLAELIALLDRCALHLAPDTGTLHLAAALGRPVVGVYGPTSSWRLGPYGQPAAVAHHPDACGVTCPHLCPRRRRCLRAIDPGEVIGLARRALADAPGRPRAYVEEQVERVAQPNQ